LPKDKCSLQEELRGGGFSAEEDFSFYSEQLQTPLSVALGISPLFLLGNRMLASICMGKPKIVEASGSKAIVWQLINQLCSFGEL
jgi:hypothetical protein